MTKRKPVRRALADGEEAPDPVLIDERAAITNFEEVRLAQRGTDKFTIIRKDQPDVEVFGHEIGMAQGNESEAAKLPLYQIVEYVEVAADVRYTRAYNPGADLDLENQSVQVENIEGDKQYIKVVKAILWPGTYDIVTRELGT